jgi:restriction system protein
MLPVLQVASEREAISVPQAADIIGQRLGLTPAESELLLPSGKQRLLHNRIHWAKFYLSKAGLVESPNRGRFRITDEGRHLLSKSPSEINNGTLIHYPSFQAFYAGSPQANENDGIVPSIPTTPDAASLATPEEQIETAHAAMLSALRSDLLTRLVDGTPSFFEQVIIELLVSMGYGGSHQDAALRLGRTGDGGVDGVINEDRLGLDRVYIQAKCYKSTTVGRPDVQAFVGSLVGFGASKGVFVTTSSFSSQAIEFARHLPQRVVLMDGDQLADLMIENNIGVRIDRTIHFKRIDQDFFGDE